MFGWWRRRPAAGDWVIAELKAAGRLADVLMMQCRDDLAPFGMIFILP
jgi:hypothetical protein